MKQDFTHQVLFKYFQMLKKNFLILTCIFIFGFIASCDKAENISTPATSNENILRIDLFGAVTSLNPQDDNLGSSGNIFPLLYSFLCVPDASGDLKPDLAVSCASICLDHYPERQRVFS